MLLPFLLLFAVLLAACLDSTLTQTIEPDDAGDSGTRDLRAAFDLSIDAPDEDANAGEFGVPCSGDLDCDSRYCIQFGDENVCTELCNEDTCPTGWSCRTLSATGGDAVRICIPDADALCRRCTSNLDCSALDDMCVTVAGENVCGENCDDGTACALGFVCESVTDLTGAAGRQCVPLTGSCSCAADQIGESRDCVRYGEFGVCAGVEVCQGDSGWSPCSAPEPIAELCDGIDNDCDGRIDEELEPRPCFTPPVGAFGSCEGTETCQGVAGWICDAPTASIEICDGLDNDCNDEIDDGLCFDGDPCTTDSCDPLTGGCNFIPRAGACDDLDVCTENDICVEGICRGDAVTCNDGNDCTADRCDASLGCVSENITAPCETGNLCTNDSCQDGVCVVGGAVDCGSSDTCMAPSCDPAVGCTTERLTGNPCDDDDVCTVSDVCSNGECIGGTQFCAGRPCSECPELDWLSLGGWCVDLFDSPQCLCICF